MPLRANGPDGLPEGAGDVLAQINDALGGRYFWQLDGAEFQHVAALYVELGRRFAVLPPIAFRREQDRRRRLALSRR